MNAKARALLYEAQRLGVRQIQKAYADDQDGRCALGVLGYQTGMSHVVAHLDGIYGLRLKSVRCPYLGCPVMRDNERILISHLNDTHRSTFEEIADALADKGQGEGDA